MHACTVAGCTFFLLYRWEQESGKVILLRKKSYEKRSEQERTI